MYNKYMNEASFDVKNNSAAAKKGKNGLSKKLITIIILSISAVLLVCGLAIIFILNFNKTIPDKVSFFDIGDHIYAQAQTNDNFNGYRFLFENKINKEKFTVDSQSSIVDLSAVDKLKPNTVYNVSVCYLGDIEGGNSEYSKAIEWKYYTYLQAPVLQENDNIISWNEVQDAEAYIVYSPTNMFNSITVYTNSISKDRLPAGKYTINVVSKSLSNPDGFKQSLSASSLEIEVHKTLQPFEKVEYYEGDKLIVITATELVDSIQIYIDGNQYIVNDFNIEYNTDHNTDVYKYTINIIALGVNPTIVGAKPYSDNPYISSEFIYNNRENT